MDLGSLLGDDARKQNKKSTSQDPLSDMLGELLGGDVQQGQPQPNTPPPGSDEVLGRLSGGESHVKGRGGVPQSGGVSGEGMPTGDIDLSSVLGSLLGGAASQGGMPQDTGGGSLSDVLGSLLGGADATAPNMSGRGADSMGGMLGGLLGSVLGGGMSGATPNMGTMGSASGLNSALSPLSNALADKLGISRETAMAVMAILVPVLLNKVMSSRQQQSGGAPIGSAGSASHRRSLTLTQGEQHEMIRQLSAQTGMDHQAAAQTLTQAIQVLGRQ